MTKHRFAEIFLVNFRLCLNEIASNKLRSFITSLGIFLGIAAVLIDMSMIRAMADDLNTQMQRMGGIDIVTINAKVPVDNAQRLQFSPSPGLTTDDGRILVGTIPGIKDFINKKDLEWQTIIANGKNAGGKVISVDHNFLHLYKYKIGAGRAFEERDFAGKVPVCIIGSGIAEELFDKKESAIGKTVMLWLRPFICIGLIETASNYDERNREMLFPVNIYHDKISAAGTVTELLLLVNNPKDIPKLKPAIENTLLSLHRGAHDFEISNNQDKFKEMKSAAAGMQIILISVAGISLLVGGISIMNIMFATIGDRIREIGIRKALGAQNSDLLMQFLIEAVLLCCVGGIPGMLLGATITLIPKGTFPFDPMLSMFDYFLAFFVAVGVGLLSGLFPAIKAAKMQPVEALRY